MTATRRRAHSLATLLAQINELSPNRSKISDGWLGDTAHAARHSDHNPDSKGVVHAIDITNDPAHGIDGWALAMALTAGKDHRVGYIISRGKIIAGESGPSPWVPRSYHGANRHDHHTHISVRPDNGDDARPWIFSLPMSEDHAKAPPVEPANPLLKAGDKGKAVERLQMILIADGAKIKPDGEFGAKTEWALKAFQKSHGLVPDGVAGPYTWDELLKP